MVQSVSPPPPTQEPPFRLEDSFLPLMQLPNRLREKMPPELFAILEGELQAIEAEVITPLLQAHNYDELRERFLATSPNYTRHALLISLLVWSTLKESLVGWFPETSHTMQTIIEQAGPRKIGEQATNDSLSGLLAFTHVMRGIERAIRSPSPPVQPEGVEELLRWISAFKVALLTVVAFLLNGDRMAKRAGVLNVPSQTGEDPYTTDEMLTEANAVIADGLELVDDATETP
jgi:hypothetical protein